MYIPLNIKTDYSLSKSIIKISELIEFAKELNLKALTITDDNMFGSIEFYNECIKNNIKPIIGINVKKNDLDIILYALNYEGYKELLKISSYYREFNDLNLTSSSNLLCIIPYETRSLYDELKRLYSNIYVSYKNGEQKSKIKLNNKLFMNEILYLRELDKEAYKYYQKLFSNDIEFDNNLKIGVEDNSYLYDKFNLTIKKEDNLLPNIEDSYNKLKKLCKDGLKKRFGETVPTKYLERLKYELETINTMGYCSYFLIVSDYVRFAKENDILVGPGRGSAVGSLVSYVLEITDIDPLKYGLLFERFLNKDRITMPDIDIDFDASRRGEVINYCINKYGNKNVAGIITFATYGIKQIIRDLGEVLELEKSDISFIINNLDNIELLKKQDNLYELYLIATKLVGIKTNMSVNASGIVISSIELDNVVPLEKHNDMYLVGYTMNYLEELGLLKMDFLALKNLSLISKVLQKVDINIKEIPLNDKETFEIFNSGNTLGIFQFETNGMKDVLNKFKITSFEDIYNLSALFRPGPKDNIDTYINRKLGKEKIDYFHPDLASILKPTYGIIIYQEQIMRIANTMASYTLGEADILRRAMSKKKEEVLIKEKEKFINRSVKNGYNLELVNKIYDYILKFAEYGFNKSHSVAYGLISYQMAYLKAHYTEEFMESLLEEVSGTQNTKDYILECKKNNVNLITPDINLSTNEYEINNGIILPFNIISGLNPNIINIINQNKPYNDIYDFLMKVDTSIINKNIVLNLIKVGCFDKFCNRKTLINNLDIIFNYIELCKELGETTKPLIQYSEEYNKKELIKMEYEVYGYYINNNPIEEYRKEYKLEKSINSLSNYLNRRVDIIVCINDKKEVILKDNKKMCFFDLTDSYSNIDGVMFNDDYNNIDVNINDIVLLSGKVNKRKGKLQIVIQNIKKIEK